MTRILAADVYDALELSAFAHGGIGAWAFTAAGLVSLRECDFNANAPVCIKGHAAFVDTPNGEVWNALSDVGIWAMESDIAVEAINRRHGKASDARVPFAQWCEELHVVRADA